MFTCVIDTSNVNVSTKDISWWRKRRDHNNNLLPDPLMILHGPVRFKMISNNTGDDLTGVLVIIGIRPSDAGPYWCGLMDTVNSTVTFLSIVPNGMYVQLYIHA